MEHTLTPEQFQHIRDNIAHMNRLEGFDVVIVCCSNGKLADYWQQRLTAVRGQVLPQEAVVLAVHEDWGGDGAGNGLGTLYAYENAVKKATEVYGYDLNGKLLAKEISVGLYHTAGKGTRLAPLPGAENNNKPGVKLPASLVVDGAQVPLTILEAVLKQTGVYAPNRKGRLSVFWGDQVFIPTVPVSYVPRHHVDILCSLGPMPAADEWVAKGLEKYGLIAVNETNEAAQVEKVSHATALELLSTFGKVKLVGVSLGSFSVSIEILIALLEEFKEELLAKVAKYDTDPHLWMPFTLEKDAYIRIMKQKKTPEEESSPHHDRMRVFLDKFLALQDANSRGVFGAVDIGEGAYWWDYGQLKLYYNNNYRLIEDDDEAKLYREFLGLTSRHTKSLVGSSVVVDPVSVLASSHMASGSISTSVLTNVTAEEVVADGAILVSVTAKKIRAAPGSVVYNVVDDSEEGIVVGEKEVLVGVFDGAGAQTRIASTFGHDGGDWWKKVIHDGQPTFEQIYKGNSNADVYAIEQSSQAAHKTLADTIKARETTTSASTKSGLHAPKGNSTVVGS